MEIAERDWEKEINRRKCNMLYYSERELFLIMSQLIKTLSLLQKNHITHRDIKLQNILLIKNKFKICDFGEARKLVQKGTIVQPVRGSELYMSPIQFYGLNHNLKLVQHNTYKSDVFSLGMCIFLAATLSFDSLSPGEQYKIYSNELEIIYKVPEIEFLINRNKFDKRVDNQFVSITGKSENACLSGEFYIDANYFSQIYSDVNADNLGIELRDSVYQAFLCPTDNITAIEIYPNGFKGNPDANLKLGIYENRGTTPGKLIKEVYASGWTKSNESAMRPAMNGWLSRWAM